VEASSWWVADPIGPMIHVVDFFDSFLNLGDIEHEVEDTSNSFNEVHHFYPLDLFAPMQQQRSQD
jgi:hypothetical protein